MNKNEKNDSTPCKFEIEFQDVDLPPFSDMTFDYIQIESFQNFLNLKMEISEKIISNDELKEVGIDKNNEIEYYYVDFQYLIIGEKIRSISSTGQEQTAAAELKFNDLYYARIFAEKADDETNNTFFKQKSVQKLIDSQWVDTYKVQVTIFLIYFLMYVIPMCICSFKISDEVNTLMFQVALFPIIILAFIESVQIIEQGYEYFIGWNLIDFSQIMVFIILSVLRYRGLDNKLLYYSQIKLLNILLAFFKLLFFVRIFNEYGYLVQLIIYCVKDLIPFLTSYITLLFVFTICYIVVKLEVDPEVKVAGLNDFFRTLLETFRCAIGELALPGYNNLMAKQDGLKVTMKPHTIYRDINVYLIWFIFFIQTYFMQILMLNFMIAVIMSTHERVVGGKLQMVICYKHRADLNYETQMLKAVFYELQEYRCLVFSTAKEEKTENEEMMDSFNKIKKKIVEQKEIKDKVNDDINGQIDAVLDN